MRIQSLRFALTTCVAAASLAACGGSQPPIGAPAAMPQSGAIAAQRDRGGSWMLPEAKSSALLYASDSKNDAVVVYSYPAAKQLGELKGFPAEPGGLCSGASGDIFVTTQGSKGSQGQSFVYEYAHGATSPIATLSDPGQASGCAVDPSSGNLAVANYFGPSEAVGEIAVYQDAKGTPTTYRPPVSTRFLFCTYDDAGNLFASEPGQDIAELPNGGNALTQIELSKDIDSDSIQWVGKRLLIAELTGPNGANSLYPVRVSGSTGTVYSPITLSSGDRSAAGFVQFLVQKNTIIGAGRRYQSVNGLLQFWKYPQGGLTTKVIRPQNRRSFFGFAVSPAPSR